MFIAALFTIARIWKQPKPIDRWMDKEDVVHIYNGILVIQKKKFESILVRWMNPKTVIQSEVSKLETDKQIPYINT